jgi:hypothetical protein
MTAIGIFLLFGAIMASLAGTTLLWRGTPLDRMWVLNVRAYNQLTPLGRALLLLGVALFTAGVGWIKLRRWGWNLAVAIIAIQITGDLVSMVMGQALRGAAGVAIAGALLFFMTRRSVREAFPAG